MYLFQLSTVKSEACNVKSDVVFPEAITFIFNFLVVAQQSYLFQSQILHLPLTYFYLKPSRTYLIFISNITALN